MAKQLAEVSQAKRAIALATTPQQANEIRARLKAIKGYLLDRGEDFGTAAEAADLMCQAASKAGELWAIEPDKAKQGPQIREISRISVRDAGFSDSKDATVCVRISEIDPQDKDLKRDELAEDRRCLSEHVLHQLWKEMNFVEDEDRPWLRVYNIWNFAKPDARFGMGHPGNIPGQVNMNLNYYLTQPGDLIVDLFAGGGTTVDVCKENNDDYGNRRCMAFDRKPVRPDITAWDLTAGLPDFAHAAMVFLDPPYWGQKAGEYSEDPTDLANMPLEAFNATLAAVVDASLARADRVALIIGATQRDGKYHDHAGWLMGRFGQPHDHFYVPYSTEQYKAFDVARAKKNRTYLNIARDLMVWGSA